MNNKELKDKVKELVDDYNQSNDRFPDKAVSQINWRKTHKDLMELKPFILKNLGKEYSGLTLDEILKNIDNKLDNEVELSEIENIAGNYVTFINHVVDTFERLTRFSFGEKTDKELELEEITKDLKKPKKKDKKLEN